MRFFLPLFAISQLLSAAATPLLLPSRDSTNLAARRILFARTDDIKYPRMKFAPGMSSSVKHEIRHNFRAHYEDHYQKLARDHPAKTALGSFVKVAGGWDKDPEELREHAMFQFHQANHEAIGAPEKLHRHLTMDFGKHVPEEQKAAIGTATRMMRGGLSDGDPAKVAQVASVGKGWHRPPILESQPRVLDDPLVFAQFHIYPPRHPPVPALEKSYRVYEPPQKRQRH